MIFKGIFENKAVSKIFREVEYRFSLVFNSKKHEKNAVDILAYGSALFIDLFFDRRDNETRLKVLYFFDILAGNCKGDVHNGQNAYISIYSQTKNCVYSICQRTRLSGSSRYACTEKNQKR